MNDSARGQAFTGSFDAATQRILPADWVTHVHLLRHGDVASLTSRVVRGQLDEPVSAHGAEQHASVVRWMVEREEQPDLIVTSDLARCRALALDLARQAGVELVIDPRLREQSMGAWEGRTWAEITAAEPAAVSAYWDDYYTARPTRGESFAEMEARALRAFDETCARQRGRRIVFVTHIGVIRAILCRVLGVHGSQALRFAPATASQTQITLSEAGAVVSLVGERPWLVAARDVDAPRVASPRATPPRIALSGSAGTGKTTLGRRLAQELGVPFLEELMRKRLEAGLDLDRLGLDGWRRLMSEQWSEQRALEDACRDGFVADRSSLDYAAFWLHYDLHIGGASEEWIARMADEAQRYDAILLFPWGVIPLVDDGVRSTNRWAQLRYQTILEGLIERFAHERVLRVAATTDFEARVAEVRRALGR